MVSGNHDDLSVWHLGDSLECYFSRYSDVEIFNEPTTRKYHEFGNVLLCFTHGDKGKRADYPLLMAAERPEMFGRTKFREIHTGHTHQTKTEEMHGIRVRTIPSLSPADAWHAENGYVGNQRNAEAYLWNRDEGLVAQFYHNDDAYPVLE
jgi:DNA repair exonuclease SbcCD nuclease subunit